MSSNGSIEREAADGSTPLEAVGPPAPAEQIEGLALTWSVMCRQLHPARGPGCERVAELAVEPRRIPGHWSSPRVMTFRLTRNSPSISPARFDMTC
jgi:hypothetical protein